MKKISLDLSKLHSYNISGSAIFVLLILAIIIISYLLFHNPYQSLHKQIFVTADKVRNYYRDNPDYWKLSTEIAKNENLISKELLQHEDYNIQVGQGENGTQGFPGNLSFDIALHNVGKSACISLLELPISTQQQLGLQKITVKNIQNTVEFSWGSEFSLPIKKHTVRNICTASENTILWNFQ